MPVALFRQSAAGGKKNIKTMTDRDLALIIVRALIMIIRGVIKKFELPIKPFKDIDNCL
jgi:hypothetical protein